MKTRRSVLLIIIATEPIGSTISFRHQGLTDSGIPRFAVFIRVRNEP
ncbi:hypothetical protein BMR04_09910 [Methylococcaceae bacterium HT3]|nr:hypothetical protein BMR04_09910 [Methylococcaceae bacterium HT3]